jgi:P27 family predicted phage terminase small subunit
MKYFWIYCAVVLMALVVALEVRSTHPLPPRPRQPVAPKGLCPEARAFWQKVISEYAIDDPGSLLILTSACEAFTRMKQAQDIIAKEGMTTIDRFNQAKCHPAILVERDSRAAMLAALKQLGLEAEPASTKQAGRQAGVPLLSNYRSKRR